MPAIVRLHVMRLLLVLAGWIGAVGGAPAQAASYGYANIPFPQPDGTTVQLYALELIPASPGPHPLAIISHGTPRSAADAPRMSPLSYRTVADWFADRGFAVVVPMRRGYGQTGGRTVDGYGGCRLGHYDQAGLSSAQDIEAVVRYMRTQSFVDAGRIVLVGHSAGGWGSVAAASQNPPGVVAMISFAGGRGSYAADKVCLPDRLVNAARWFGSTARVPSLWIYSKNDHFFGPQLARDMFDAYHGAGAPAEFLAEPSCSTDGHQLINRCPDRWHDAVAAFLHRTVGTK